jgi:hypothetical protein
VRDEPARLNCDVEKVALDLDSFFTTYLEALRHCERGGAIIFPSTLISSCIACLRYF